MDENEIARAMKLGQRELLVQEPLDIEKVSSLCRPRLGNRIHLMTLRAIRLVAMRGTLGRSLSAALLYESGRRMALEMQIESLDELLDEIGELMLGVTTLVEANDERVVIDEYDCATCSGLPDIGEPLCYLEAGFISGALSELFRSQVLVRETKCWGLGDRVCRMEADVSQTKGPGKNGRNPGNGQAMAEILRDKEDASPAEGRSTSPLSPILSEFLLQLNQVEATFRSELIDVLRGLVHNLDSRYSPGHSSRVARTARMLALRLKLDRREVETVEDAAFLHDIGKIAVPDRLLVKVCPLDRSEEVVLFRHPQLGAELLARIGFLRPSLPYIKHHHERIDGSGYPDGLQGDEIPLGARILAVADAYDAMRSGRPACPPMPVELAVNALRASAGEKFDREIVQQLIGLVDSIEPEYPEG